MLCLLTAALSIYILPTALGLVKYMAAMSSQTVWADGIAAFPYNAAPWFMPMWGEHIFVNYLSDILEFLFMYLPALLALWYILYLRKLNSNWKILFEEKNYLFAALLIVTVISMTFTFVRMDEGAFMARGAVTAALMRRRGIMP